jgi:hypothetical protein
VGYYYWLPPHTGKKTTKPLPIKYLKRLTGEQIKPRTIFGKAYIQS